MSRRKMVGVHITIEEGGGWVGVYITIREDDGWVSTISHGGRKMMGWCLHCHEER